MRIGHKPSPFQIQRRAAAAIRRYRRAEHTVLLPLRPAVMDETPLSPAEVSFARSRGLIA